MSGAETGQGSSRGQPSLIDLFREEARTQAQILSDGLLRTGTRPTRPGDA